MKYIVLAQVTHLGGTTERAFDGINAEIRAFLWCKDYWYTVTKHEQDRVDLPPSQFLIYRVALDYA